MTMAYVFQIQSAAWYIKLVPWIFGEATVVKPPAPAKAGEIK
jgi:hypothetical protein